MACPTYLADWPRRRTAAHLWGETNCFVSPHFRSWHWKAMQLEGGQTMAKRSRRARKASQKGQRRNGILRLLMSLRLFRSQMKRSGKMDGLAYGVALLSAVRTYRGAKAQKRATDARKTTTLRELLGG